MDIKIHNTNAAQSCLDQNKALWDIWTKDNLKKLIFPLSFSLILIAFGLFDLSNNDKVVVMGNTTYYNFHLFLSIGIVFLVTTLLSLIRLAREKSIFFQKVNSIAFGHTQNSNTITIELSENSVKYQSHELSQEMKWSVFTNYKIYKNYIILSTNNYILSAVIIDKKLISESEYTDLISFVKTKLSEKK